MWATATHRVGALIVGVALVYATVAQGAFAADQAVVVFGLVGLAAVVALAGRRAVARPVVVAVGLLVALALWTAARAAGVGGGDWLGAAVWAGLPIIAIAAVVVAVAGLAARARTVLTAVVIAAGLSVAATGWAGVAWHIEPLALVSSGLWRASSTLTYANASAAFLVTALFTIAAAAERLGARRARLVTAALLVGLLATMSRAGLFTLVVGLVVAVAVSGRSRSTRRTLAALWPALPGAAVAAVGLLPGLAAESVPHPLVAVAALAAGLGSAALTPRHGAIRRTPDPAAAGPAPDPAAARHAPDAAAPEPAFGPAAVGRASGPAAVGWAFGPATGRASGSAAARRRVLVAAAVVAALLVAAPLVGAGQAGTVGELVATRLSAESPERADLRRVTAEQFASAPLTGVGPGRLELVYVDYLGRLVAAEYTHDEFLQTAAETGLVGAGLAAAVFACLGAAAFRRRHTAGGPFAAAILAAFAAHSTFDFLWHIPVLPLLVGIAVVPLLDHPTTQEEEVTR